MKCYSIAPFFPTIEVWIGFYQNVANIGELKAKTIKGELQACFVNPELILDKFQVLTAVNKALHQQKIEKMKTKSLYSEILFSLSPTKKINESLKDFGLDSGCSQVLTVVVGTKEEADEVVRSIQGEAIDIEELKMHTNLEKLKKVYKIEGNENANLLDSVVTKLATKDVK